MGFPGSSKGGSGRFEKFLSGGLKSRVNSPTVGGSGRFRTGSCAVLGKVLVGSVRFSLKFEGCFQEISGRSGTLFAVATERSGRLK